MLTITMLGATLWCGPAGDATAAAPPDAPTAPETPTSEPPATATPPTADPTPSTPAPAPVAPTATVTAPAPAPDVPPQPAAPEGTGRRKSKIAVGGFGAFDLRMSEVDSAFGLTVGALGGVTLANRLMLGAGGYSLVYHDRDYSTLTDEYDLHVNYAGAYIGVYALRSNRIDGGVGAFLGGGRVCMESQVDNNCFDREDVFAAHLEGLIYIKLARIVRLGLILGYDFFAGANDWKGPDDWDLSGFAGTVRIEIGKYDSPPPKSKRGGRRGRR